MNRRSFFKLALGGVAATAAAVTLPAILNPEVPKTVAYSTYIMGQDAFFVNKNATYAINEPQEPLTLADIRECVKQLKSRSVKPVEGQFAGWVHPDRADEVNQWIRYKWNYQWTAGNS